MAVRAVLFDFDGTLVQTRDSSWSVFRDTSREFDLGIHQQADFFRLFENNFFKSIGDICGDHEKAERAGRHFLGALQRDYRPPFVPGMIDVVRAMAGSFALAVLSSNAVATIRRILTEAGIAQCFSHVFSGDVEIDKRTSVRRFLTDQSYTVGRACSPAYRETDTPTLPQSDEVVLVTDTVGDVRHARESGIRAVGVAWGMHTDRQLTQAGAEFVALWPQELVAHLLPGGFSRAACECAVGSMAPSCTCTCTCPVPGHGPVSRDPNDALSRAAEVRRERVLAAAAERKAGAGTVAVPRRDGIDPMLFRAVRLIGTHRPEPAMGSSSLPKPPPAPTGAEVLLTESVARSRRAPAAAGRDR